MNYVSRPERAGYVELDWRQHKALQELAARQTGDNAEMHGNYYRDLTDPDAEARFPEMDDEFDLRATTRVEAFLRSRIERVTDRIRRVLEDNGETVVAAHYFGYPGDGHYSEVLSSPIYAVAHPHLIPEYTPGTWVTSDISERPKHEGTDIVTCTFTGVPSSFLRGQVDVSEGLTKLYESNAVHIATLHAIQSGRARPFQVANGELVKRRDGEDIFKHGITKRGLFRHIFNMEVEKKD